MPVKVDCEQCGKTVSKTPAKAEPPNFCSKDCFYKSRRKKEEYTCPNCNNNFERIPSEIRTENPCCSEECKYEYRSEKSKVVVDCDFCGDSIERRKFRVNENNYCNHECYAKSKEKDINWHSKAKHRHWANTVKNKYEECVECGSDKKLQAHHKIPVEIEPEKADEPENGIALCAKCHSKKHPDVPENLFKNVHNEE